MVRTDRRLGYGQSEIAQLREEVCQIHGGVEGVLEIIGISRLYGVGGGEAYELARMETI